MPEKSAVGNSDTDTDTDTDSDVDCGAVFTVSSSISTAISTVGIVEWSSTLDSTASASIEFGLDTNYGYTAPVDLTEANYRTLLLGMKPSSTYHYRITASTGSVTCISPDNTIETGAQPTGINLTINTVNESALSGGFIISSFLSSQRAFILDKDGDLVWWYEFKGGFEKSDISRAKMSADGKSMWAGNSNIDGEGYGYLFRVSMDGFGEEELNINRHHDFTVLPDNSIVYIEYTENDGDRIVERDASGATTTIYSIGDDFPGSGFDWSHCNAIHYVPSDDAYTISCLHLNNVIKVSRSGTLLWDFEGDGDVGDFSGVSWVSQHGHQLLDNGNLLIFNNGEGGFGRSSSAREFSLNESTHEASEVWSYDGGQWTGAYGDVQRTANRNTLVTYSDAGVIHEVTPAKSLVRSIVTESLGYLDWRETLYGPPNRW